MKTSPAFPLAVLVLGLASLFAPDLAARYFCHSILVDLGPNDEAYILGFRESWERDGNTRFRWTSASSSITLPLRLKGEGVRLRMRLRRHFVDPADVRISTEGRTVSRFSISAASDSPYRIVELDLPTLVGAGPFTLQIDSAFSNARPLGVAIDWIELIRITNTSSLIFDTATLLRLLAAVVGALLILRLCGAPLALCVAPAALAMLGALAHAAVNPLAFVRLLQFGACPFLGVVAIPVLLSRLRRLGHVPADCSIGMVWGSLAALSGLAFIVRSIVLLHPQYFYPDRQIHALVLWRLDRLGLSQFLSAFTAIQFEHSLGLQNEGGHWYAFPYPPALYVFCLPLVRLLGYSYDVAVSMLPVILNSLETVVVFLICRQLGAATRTSLGAAYIHALLPLFTARLSLGYFPAVLGHFGDMTLVLLVLIFFDRLGKPVTFVPLSLALAFALLTYTQSLLNFGVLIPVFLVVSLIHDRSGANVRRLSGLVVVGVVGVLLSLGLFYGRYIPVAVKIFRGEPMAGEEIKLRLDATRPLPADFKPEVDDPDSGPRFDLWRGMRKAVRRAYVFYGLYSILVPIGFGLMIRRVEERYRTFVGVWFGTYLLLNLASGSLPGPNLFRYNKDLEIVAPIFCLCLAYTTVWPRIIWTRIAEILLYLSYTVFSVGRAARYLGERILFER